MFSSTHSSLCRKEAEQTVPVSCEASTNTTLSSAASDSETAAAVFQTGCLEMVARLLGDNVMAVVLVCLSVVVIQVRYITTQS